MDRSKRATNPHCFNANGTWKKGQKFSPSKRYTAIRAEHAEVERKLAAERKRSHSELANQILGLGNVVQSETHSISKRCGRLRNLCCCKRGGCVPNLRRSSLRA